ncbi:MAG: Hpt domain-containing protein [Thermodesulfobacteriota bacterium]|nr:Hpt domain-containing protein [Thermodesulfobacteriota bacterium]
MSRSTPIDIDEALAVMDGDKELLLDCFNDFVEDIPGMLKRIESAMKARDSRELQIASHKLKGSLRYLAAADAADASYNLETSGETGNLEDAPKLFAALVAECDRVIAFIQAYQQTAR